MDYQQLRDAVWPAFGSGDFGRGYAMLDEYLASADGDVLGQTLVLKASVIATFDIKRSVEGLALIDEALPLVCRSPWATAMGLKVALALVYQSGDTERAVPYEDAACRFLMEYGSHPEVLTQRYGLQLNLGLVASIRGDHATAYWYLVQASNSITLPEVSEERRRAFGFNIQVRIALACLRVRRYFEAQEALDLAEACGADHPQRLRVPIYRSELLRQLGQVRDAKEILLGIRSEVEASHNHEIRAWFYWVYALVAQNLGALPEYHKNLPIAQKICADHHIDFLLGEMQRFQRDSTGTF